MKSDSRTTTTTCTTTVTAAAEKHTVEPQIATLSCTQPVLCQFKEWFTFSIGTIVIFLNLKKSQILNLNFLTPPKSTSLCKTAWYGPPCVKIGQVIFAVGEDKKKGNVQEVTKALYFTYSWRSPLWTDFNQILHTRRHAGRIHLCKFWYGKIERFGIWGVRVWALPLKRLVTLTTVLRYCTACDVSPVHRQSPIRVVTTCNQPDWESNPQCLNRKSSVLIVTPPSHP